MSTTVADLMRRLDNKVKADASQEASTKGGSHERTAPTLPPAGPTRRPNGQEYLPRSIGRHEDIALLRSAQRHGEHILLYGPPGTGKNALAEAAFADKGLEIVTGSADLTETDLLGTFVQDPNTGVFTWASGPLIKSLQTNVPLFVDEIMLIEPRVLSVLYPLMDGTGVLRVPMNPTMEPIPVPDGWIVIGAGNPEVDGARMSEALRSRFAHHIEIPTDWELARSMGVDAQLVTIAANLDHQRRGGIITWSPQMRELRTFASLAERYGTDYAASALLAACPAQDRDTVQKALMTQFPGIGAARLTGQHGV